MCENDMFTLDALVSMSHALWSVQFDTRALYMKKKAWQCTHLFKCRPASTNRSRSYSSNCHCNRLTEATAWLFDFGALIDEPMKLLFSSTGIWCSRVISASFDLGKSIVSTDKQFRWPIVSWFSAFNIGLAGATHLARACRSHSTWYSRKVSANRTKVIPSDAECSINKPQTPSLPMITFINLSYHLLAEKCNDPCSRRANCCDSLNHWPDSGARVASSKHNRNNDCSMQRKFSALIDSGEQAHGFEIVSFFFFFFI